MKRRLLVLLSVVLLSFSCQKDKKEEPEYFMSATINGLSWSADKGYAWAQIEYSYYTQEHHLEIYSQTEHSLEDSIRYQVGISVYYPPAKGKYYFNNNGPEVNPIHGAIGDAYGWAKNKNDDFFSGHSINGSIEITDITKDFVKGNFEYDAYVEVDSQPLAEVDTIRVKNGNFLIPINVVSGKPWNGPL